MTLYRFSLSKPAWPAPWVFECESRNDPAAEREVQDLQALYTLQGEPRCGVVFEQRASGDSGVTQGRRVIVDWSVPGAGVPEIRALVPEHAVTPRGEVGGDVDALPRDTADG